jgi:hypothetical protein
MSFPEKRAILLVSALTLVYGTYFAVIGVSHWDRDVDSIVYQPLLIAAVVPLALITAAGAIALALTDLQGAEVRDERDRVFERRAGFISSMMLTLTVFAGLVCAMLEVHTFFIAHVLLGGWVVAEVADQIALLVLYRRGT